MITLIAFDNLFFQKSVKMNPKLPIKVPVVKKNIYCDIIEKLIMSSCKMLIKV